MSRLATFIRANPDPILVEWEGFARALPMGGEMDIAQLRDHAKEMLDVIADDLETPQSKRKQSEKAAGKHDAKHEERRDPKRDPKRDAKQDGKQGDTRTAAQEHGAGRAASGFSMAQMVSEFRALRASVIRLWRQELHEATSTDLDDMTRFNEAIDQAIAESITRYADDLGQSKERFLAILAHDLRTPLGAIITSTRFMLDTAELPEPHQTLVTRIASSSTRMNQMVLDLLDFTRTRFGDSIPIVREPVDARKLVHDVVAEVATLHPQHAVHIEAAGDLRGEWDGARLGQALGNLIANAVHHGSPSTPITVTATGTAADVSIVVHNHGAVIPKSQLAKLFEAMKATRLNAARDPRHLGLGLYIVEKIVSAHGGSIAVTSSRERGTAFTVRLPRGVPGREPDTPRPTPTPTPKT